MFPGASMKKKNILGHFQIFPGALQEFLMSSHFWILLGLGPSLNPHISAQRPMGTYRFQQYGCSWGPTCDNNEGFLVFSSHVLVWQRVGQSLLVEPLHTYMASNIQLSTETWNPWTCSLGGTWRQGPHTLAHQFFLPELHKKAYTN